MKTWLDHHAQTLQTVCALATAGAAIGALVLVPWQIAANAHAGREQSAKEIYREYLNISIQRADLSAHDLCAPVQPATSAAYEAYVDYLLYTAEQVLDLDPDAWGRTIAAQLERHQRHLCTFDPTELEMMTEPVAALVAGLQTGCDTLPACAGTAP